MSDTNCIPFRKLSPGLTRGTPKLTLKVKGYCVVGRQRVQLLPTLIRLLGLRVGQRLKVSATRRGVALSVRRVPSALHATAPRKRSAADQVRFQRRWQQTLRALRRVPDKRRWVPGSSGRARV